MKKLKLHLKQFKNTVEMRVLQQDKIYKAIGENVRVGSHPALGNDCIFLRGDDSLRDNDISCITFYSEQEASAYLEKVIGWLDEIFYPNNDKEIKRGDEVIINLGNGCRDTRYFLVDLGKDVINGRYITATFRLDNGKYSDIKPYNQIEKIKNTGYNNKIDEYYGEID